MSDHPAGSGVHRWREGEESGRDSLTQVLGRRAWLLALFIAVTALAAYLLAGLQREKYTATSSLVFGQPNAALQVFQNSTSSATDPAAQSETEIQMVLSQAVADRVARVVRGLTPGEVRARIAASQEGVSNVVGITATDTSARRAARLANTYAHQFVAYSRDSQEADIQDARERLAVEIAQLAQAGATTEVQQLRQQDAQLAVLQSVANGNVEVLDQAEVPSSPSSPNTQRIVLLGGFGGLLLGLGAALALDQIDRRLRRPSEIEAALGVPVLAVIPRSFVTRKPTAAALAEHRFAWRIDTEPFRALRARLRYLDIGREIRSVLITSAARGEGRSTVCVGLAAAVAAAGERVLLIEADWRRPILGDRLSQNGLSLLLDGVESLDDVIVKLPIEAVSRGARSASAPDTGLLEIDVVPAGPIPANSSVLIESPLMRNLIIEAEDRYDLVVIDTPPISVVADAFALMPSVSGVIPVTRLHRSTRDAIRLLRQLSDLATLVLGVVVNGADRPRYDRAVSLRLAANRAARGIALR